MMMSGKMRPKYNGCSFTVEGKVDGDQLVYLVTLWSPFHTDEVVDQKTCTAAEVGEWLLNRVDW